MYTIFVNSIDIGIKWLQTPNFEILKQQFIYSPQKESGVYKLFGGHVCLATVNVRGKMCNKYKCKITIKSAKNSTQIAKELFLQHFKYEILSLEMWCECKINFRIDPARHYHLLKSLNSKNISCHLDFPKKTHYTNANCDYSININKSTINEQLKWTKKYHRCFEKSFRLVVKELLLITKFSHLKLPKDVLCEIIIPLLADHEQKKYTSTQQKFFEIVLKRETIEARGIKNYVMFNYIVQSICELQKDIEICI